MKKRMLDNISMTLFVLAGVLFILPFIFMGVMEFIFFLSFGKIQTMDLIGNILFHGDSPIIFTIFSWSLLCLIIGGILQWKKSEARKE